MFPPKTSTGASFYFDMPPHDEGYAAFADDPTLALRGIQHRRTVDEHGEFVWTTLYLQTCNEKEVKRIRRRLGQLKKSCVIKHPHKRKSR
jgi:hypothetical protein